MGRVKNYHPRRKGIRDIIVENSKHLLADQQKYSQWGGCNSCRETNTMANWGGERKSQSKESTISVRRRN